jgi:hypothetical protein
MQTLADESAAQMETVGSAGPGAQDEHWSLYESPRTPSSDR